MGPDTVQYILGHTRAKSVVSCRRNVDKLCEAKQSGECPTFEVAILVDGVTPDVERKANAANLQLISLSKVEAVGAELIASTGHHHSPPSSGDIATFSYTSGTTGTPKGALLTHQNLISSVAGVRGMGEEQAVDFRDRHLSYLPLAHIFERIVMAQILMLGACASFFRGDPTLLIEDLQACRPTVIPVAPRVLNKIYDKVSVD